MEMGAEDIEKELDRSLEIFKQLALCIWNNIYKDMMINICNKYMMITHFICKIMLII